MKKKKPRYNFQLNSSFWCFWGVRRSFEDKCTSLARFKYWKYLICMERNHGYLLSKFLSGKGEVELVSLLRIMWPSSGNRKPCCKRNSSILHQCQRSYLDNLDCDFKFKRFSTLICTWTCLQEENPCLLTMSEMVKWGF